MTPQEYLTRIISELEFQRRVIVGLKEQRDIDRKRRLQFIRRLKKEKQQQDLQIVKIKLIASASLFISLLLFIIKY